MTITEKVNIYDNIVKRAKEKGMSINFIEKTAGLGIGSVCKWNTVSPTVKNLKAVADILDVSVDRLIGSPKSQVGQQWEGGERRNDSRENFRAGID